MEFLNIMDEIKYYQKMFSLRKEIEDFLFAEGYLVMEPSIFENYDQFININSRTDKKSTVKLLDNNSGILILTPDITTGIVNRFLPRWEYGDALKIFYYGKTYKHDKGGIRENREIGIEIIGDKGLNTDIYVLKTAMQIIDRYSQNYLLEIGNSKFLKGLMDSCSFAKEDYENILDILSSKSEEELKEYISKYETTDAMITLSNILALEGTLGEIVKLLGNLYLNDLMKQAVEELKRVDEYMKTVTNNVIYDLSIVSRLGYYDGTILRGYIEGSNKEIIKGGRYDSFARQFGNDVGAMGFTLELDELFKTLYRKEGHR